MNTTQLSVVQDVATRWNSKLYMFERMDEIKEAICLYAANNSKVRALSAADTELLKNCITVLKPFDEVTKSISADFSCISEIIPLVTSLKVIIKKNVTAHDRI